MDDNNFTTDRVPRMSCELKARIASLEESIREKDKKLHYLKMKSLKSDAPH